MFTMLFLLLACGEEKDSGVAYEGTSCENYYEAQHDCYVAIGSASGEYNPAAAEQECSTQEGCPDAFYECVSALFIECVNTEDAGSLSSIASCDVEKNAACGN